MATSYDTNNGREFKWIHYSQVYFLCSEYTVDERLKHLQILKLHSIQVNVSLDVQCKAINFL